jgi:uncharacterized protein (TIGR03086 family)
MNATEKTSNGPALMAAAAAEAARVVDGSASTPLDSATPCTDWDLRTLLNHTILWTAYSAERRAYGESAAEDLMSKDFAGGPDYARDYQAQLAKAVQAWSDPAAWDRELTVMGNAMNASDVGAMLIMEMVLHSWDVARATGQDYHCDGELADALLATVSAQADMFRQYQGFAPVVPVPDDAPAFDQALALAGRDPQWKPS